MKRCVLVLFVLAALLAASTAFAAPANPVLRVITWAGYAPQELLDKFTAETGYNVEITLSNNEEMISKLRATRGGGSDPRPAVTGQGYRPLQEQHRIYQPIDYSHKRGTDRPPLLNGEKEHACGRKILCRPPCLRYWRACGSTGPRRLT